MRTPTESINAAARPSRPAPGPLGIRPSRSVSSRYIGRDSPDSGQVIRSAAMPRRSVLLARAGAATLLGACGGHIEVSKQDAALHHGAVLFNERCSGCHTLDAANARGSKPAGQAQPGERTDGPNFNVRKEAAADVL